MKISFRHKIAFIIIVIFFIKAANAGTALAVTTLNLGPIFTDTTLDPSVVYIVTDTTATVSPGATLTIPAGTHIIFTAGSDFHVSGMLKIQGTSSHHVVIAGGTPPPSLPETGDDPDSMTDIDDGTPNIDYGFVFAAGSVSTISYADISNADPALRPTPDSTLSLDHVSFIHDSVGIQGGGDGAILNLSHVSFDTVAIPAIWDFHGSFNHTSSTFSNTGIKGWEYSASPLPGEVIELSSTDGEYFLPDINVPAAASISVGAGATIFIKDDHHIVLNGGTFTVTGSKDKPVAFYGDGHCSNHSPFIASTQSSVVSIKYATMHDLCNGLQGIGTTGLLSHVDLDTVAGPALDFSNHSHITTDYVTMNDVYQAFNISGASVLNSTDDTITIVNTDDPAIIISDQSSSTLNDIGIDGATTCLDVSHNSSLTADKLTLSHCSKTGLFSINDDATVPTALTLTHSEIGNSGSAMDLTHALVEDISNDNFHDDDKGVILNHMPKTVLADNDWGDDSGPTIDTNPGGIGTIIDSHDVSELIYRPWIGMADSPKRNPIIIVPGLTGSVLTKDYGDKAEIWPNLTQLVLSPSDSFLNDLELSEDGNPDSARPMKVGDIIRAAGQADIFEGLIAALLNDGYKEGVDLFVMPYDWRLSNTKNEALLGTSIANALAVSGQDKVSIIAHSMGGLLVKDYLAQHHDTPLDKLFFIATPHMGTPKAFKALMYGDDMGYSLTLASLLSIHVLSADRIKTIAQNMPSVYELLPSADYLNDVGQYIEDFVGQTPLSNILQIKQYLTDMGRNANLFSFAKNLHDATDTLDLSTVPTYNFVGCGLTKTISKIMLKKEVSADSDTIKLGSEYRLAYTEGDGTIPMASAADIYGGTNYFVTSGSHGTLPSVSSVKSAITAILDGQEVSDTSGISTSSDICKVSGDIAEVHSPVSLDIYDEQGNHTGPTDNGDIEYGIPNVDYEIINKDKIAFLPKGPTYTVVDHGQDDGSYDMYISHSDDNDNVTTETYFSQVPVTSQSIGTVMINPNSSEYAIMLDNDGDGTTDTQIAPSSKLDASQAADTIPPVTTADYMDGTMTFSASDDISGVLHTTYSLDNVHWISYVDPFDVDAGATVYFFSQDRAGNVEDVQSVTVPGSPDQSSETDNTDTTDPASNDDTDNGNTTIINTTNNISNATPDPVPVKAQPADSEKSIVMQTPAVQAVLPVPPSEKETETVQVQAIMPAEQDNVNPLLASAEPVGPHDNDPVSVIAIVLAAILIIIAARRFFRKKSKY